MENWQIITIALLPVVLGPLIAAGRSWWRYRRRPVNVIVVCPHCQTDIGLEKLRNYVCINCHRSVVFFASTDNIIPLSTLKRIKCLKCGILNLEGVKYCQRCGALCAGP